MYAMLKKERSAFQMMFSFIDVFVDIRVLCLPSEGFLRYTIHCVIFKSQHEIKINLFKYTFLVLLCMTGLTDSAHYSNKRFLPLKRFYFLITLQNPSYFQSLFPLQNT